MGHMAAHRTLYDVLGVAQGAPPEEVRKCYKTRVLETHPDKLGPEATDSERLAAEARFRDVRTAFEVLGDPAKRRAYDNGLEYHRRHVNIGDMQAKLARERAEWARQAELRHEERMRVLREEIRASQKRYRETMANAELRYQEKIRAMEELRYQDKMRAMEEEFKQDREAEREAQSAVPASYDLAGEILAELKRKNPEWEIRRREVLRRQAERIRSQGKAAAKG